MTSLSRDNYSNCPKNNIIIEFSLCVIHVESVHTKILGRATLIIRPIIREPHTHRAWSTSFRLVVTWSTERNYVRTYIRTRLQIVGWGRGDYQREGGVSQTCLRKSTSCILDIHKMVNWQLSKQDSHWPVSHDHIAGSCVNSSRWRDLFGSCPLTS